MSEPRGTYAVPERPTKPNWKPVRQQAKANQQTAKATRKAADAKDERSAKLKHRQHMRALRLDCWTRDKGCCRVCDVPVALDDERVAKRMQMHHVVYRSAGGQDVIENVCSTCWACHKAEHAHEIRISGDPMTTLIVKRISRETGKVNEVWESTV